ncbi:MAG: sigma factor-like helix-turn-helix DNA-binding protein [Bacillota bacterium]|nr:transcriptional regulator [Candidatus Fermentithermobacillaceae bacterium]
MSYSPEKVHEFSVLFDLYGEMLAPRQQEVLTLKLHEDLSLMEISERLGISRQACDDALKRGQRALRQLEERIGLRERICSEEALVSDIVAKLRSMNSENWREVRDMCLRVLCPILSGGDGEDGV